jgi:hypothetical protein
MSQNLVIGRVKYLMFIKRKESKPSHMKREIFDVDQEERMMYSHGEV